MTPHEPPLSLAISRVGDVVTIRLNGELDIASKTALEQCISEHTAAGRAHVVLDLSQLEFVDSTGISTFVGASRDLYSRGGWLRLENVNGMPRKVLELTGVYELLTAPMTYGEPSWSLDGLDDVGDVARS